MARKRSAGADTHRSILRYEYWRYLKLALLLCVVAIACYIMIRPAAGPSGNSWVGYGLGGLSAFIILLLCWLGVRKRRYKSNMGTVRGWVSAHVYLGLSLIVLGTLHTGFQFGLNIHTLAWVLMMLVIFSGAIGLLAYANYPIRIASTRAKRSREEMIGEIMEMNEDAIQLADKIDPDIHQAMLNSSHNIQIGGSVWQQVRGIKSRNDRDQALVRDRLVTTGGVNDVSDSASHESTKMFMASKILKQKDIGAGERLRQLLDVVSRRDELLDMVNEDITLEARMRGWLLLHIPLSVALVAALIAHVFSVFFYW